MRASCRLDGGIMKIGHRHRKLCSNWKHICAVCEPRVCPNILCANNFLRRPCVLRNTLRGRKHFLAAKCLLKRKMSSWHKENIGQAWKVSFFLFSYGTSYGYVWVRWGISAFSRVSALLWRKDIGSAAPTISQWASLQFIVVILATQWCNKNISSSGLLVRNV